MYLLIDEEVTACYSFIQTSRELYLFLLEKEALVTTHKHINITVHEGTCWNVRVCSSNKPANEMYLSAVIRKYPRSRFRRCLGLIMNQLCLVERQLQLVSVCVCCFILEVYALLSVPDVYENVCLCFLFDSFCIFSNVLFYIWSQLLLRDVWTATVQCFKVFTCEIV